MLDTSDKYTEFDAVGSGLSGTIEGLIDMGGSASALRYRKQIVVSVSAGTSGLVRGRWKVRGREDASRDASGAYTGGIFFEQEVEWTAMVTNVDLGGISLITWQPTGDAGSGKSYTSNCNGEECAVLDALVSDESKAAYNATGAWRFLDHSTLGPESPVNQKIDLEKGFTIFTSEGVASAGGDGFLFYAVWQSPDYLCDFPEGSILETVFDRWQVGTLDDEALFAFSYKPGTALYASLRDIWTGQAFYFYPARAGHSGGQGGGGISFMCVARSRRVESFDKHDDDPIVALGTFGSFQAHIHGHDLTVLYQKATGLGIAFSFDDARSWKESPDMVSGISQIDSVLDDAGGQLILLGKTKIAQGNAQPGDIVRVLFVRTDELSASKAPLVWKVASVDKASSTDATHPLPTKAKGRLSRTDSALEWMIEDSATIQIWHSKDEGETWTPSFATP
jgi:hypothetical protein